MCFKQKGASSTLKLVEQFKYLGSNISSTGSDVNIRLVKAWNSVDWLSIIRKSHIFDITKRDSFQAVTVVIQSYGCTTWTLANALKKS